MDTRFQHLTAAQLRTIIIHEMRKFALALECGSSISDLQEIRNHIRALADTLTTKEGEESYYGNVGNSTQTNQATSVG
jgi:hypothetical protein